MSKHDVKMLRIITAVFILAVLVLACVRAIDSVAKPANPIAAAGPALRVSARQESTVEWHDATEFDIEGKGWQDTESTYDRLPLRAKGVVPQEVWGLSKQSAGISVRFETDSPSIHVRWSLTQTGLAMPHMPATGVSGVDIYARDSHGRWQFLQDGRPTRQENNTTACSSGAKKDHFVECQAYLPLYNGTRRMEIGVPTGAGTLRKAPPRTGASAKPVVFYGTSIVQGGCASRPGMAHVNILGRKMNRPTINLGFSGSGKMEPEVAGFLAELDPAMFVIDCLWNVSTMPAEEVTNRVLGLVRIIRKARPDTPIVLVGQSNIRISEHPTVATRAQEHAVHALMAEGFKGLHLMSGKELLGNDSEATVDGVHPNDLGMARQSETMLPYLQRVLRSTSPAPAR